MAKVLVREVLRQNKPPLRRLTGWAALTPKHPEAGTQNSMVKKGWSQTGTQTHALTHFLPRLLEGDLDPFSPANLSPAAITPLWDPPRVHAPVALCLHGWPRTARRRAADPSAVGRT